LDVGERGFSSPPDRYAIQLCGTHQCLDTPAPRLTGWWTPLGHVPGDADSRVANLPVALSSARVRSGAIRIRLAPDLIHGRSHIPHRPWSNGRWTPRQSTVHRSPLVEINVSYTIRNWAARFVPPYRFSSSPIAGCCLKADSVCLSSPVVRLRLRLSGKRSPSRHLRPCFRTGCSRVL